MDTREIYEYMQGYSQFLGVYAINHIPDKHQRPCSLIVNTDPCTAPGEHWVAIFLNNDLTGEYFDSFGLPPLHLPIYIYLNLADPQAFPTIRLLYRTLVLQLVDFTSFYF